jgi:phosphatidylglycerophosphate synthase
MMDARSSLRTSIIRLVAGLFIAQTAILAGVVLLYDIDAWQLGLFAGIALVYHAALGVFLYSRREDFRIEGAEDPLPRVNLANALTMVRLSSIPTALFLILFARSARLLPIALPYLGLVFLTDFFDGIVARSRGEITVIGRYLDSTSDYLIIVGTSIVFFCFHLVPLWLFILILARLVLFAVAMGIAAVRQGKATTVSTFIGKASIFSIMVLFLLEIAGHFQVPVIGNPIVVRAFEYVTAAVVAVSFVDKGIFLRKLFSGRL